MNVLIVEDNASEHVILKEAFKTACARCQLHIVNDGFEALEFLNREGRFRDAPDPQLMILDLNLPRKNGRELLVEMKTNPKWEHLPILVLSNSESPKDICQCYSLNVNAYINKPASFEELVELVSVIDGFWLKKVRQCSH